MQASILLLAALVLACSSMLAGCGPAKPGAADIRTAETARPQNAQLAEKYERSCLACHGRPNAGAPLTGFAAAWQEPLQKGLPLLLQNARQGLNAMPPMGLCNDCSDAELQALIVFMSGKGTK